MSAADRVYARIDDAVQRGEITDQEARDEYFAAEEEALIEQWEEWR